MENKYEGLLIQNNFQDYNSVARGQAPDPETTDY